MVEDEELEDEEDEEDEDEEDEDEEDEELEDDVVETVKVKASKSLEEITRYTAKCPLCNLVLSDTSSKRLVIHMEQHIYQVHDDVDEVEFEIEES